MSVVYYHSDWHFNHTFVAKLRGYETSEAHDDALIERINSVVTKRDHLWVLGDLFMGSVMEGLKQCARVNGIKHLVLGNHDAAHPMHKGSHSKQRRSAAKHQARARWLYETLAEATVGQEKS